MIRCCCAEMCVLQPCMCQVVPSASAVCVLGYNVALRAQRARGEAASGEEEGEGDDCVVCAGDAAAG